MDTNSKTQISLRIDEEMLKRLKTRSVKNMRTVSGQVLKYIELGLHMDEGLIPGSMWENNPDQFDRCNKLVKQIT